MLGHSTLFVGNLEGRTSIIAIFLRCHKWLRVQNRYPEFVALVKKED